MNFSKQEKDNASKRMQTLFNAINNEIKSSLEYVGSMKRGNRNRINYDGGFDLDADIELNIDIDYYSAQQIYSDIIKIIKNNGLRGHEHYELKSAAVSNNAIIHIWSENANYTFDVAIKTTSGYTLKYNNNYSQIFYWE